MLRRRGSRRPRPGFRALRARQGGLDCRRRDRALRHPGSPIPSSRPSRSALSSFAGSRNAYTPALFRQGESLARRRPARQLGLGRHLLHGRPWAPSSSATPPTSKRSKPGPSIRTAGSSGPRSSRSSSWPASRGFLPAIYEISASVFPVDDDLVQKANGWLLREAGKADAARLERFLLEHGPAVPRTTLRYAIERFPPARRKALLLETK